MYYSHWRCQLFWLAKRLQQATEHGTSAQQCISTRLIMVHYLKRDKQHLLWNKHKILLFVTSNEHLFISTEAIKLNLMISYKELVKQKILTEKIFQYFNNHIFNR